MQNYLTIYTPQQLDQFPQFNGIELAFQIVSQLHQIAFAGATVGATVSSWIGLSFVFAWF